MDRWTRRGRLTPTNDKPLFEFPQPSSSTSPTGRLSSLSRPKAHSPTPVTLGTVSIAGPPSPSTNKSFDFDVKAPSPSSPLHRRRGLSSSLRARPSNSRLQPISKTTLTPNDGLVNLKHAPSNIKQASTRTQDDKPRKSRAWTISEIAEAPSSSTDPPYRATSPASSDRRRNLLSPASSQDQETASAFASTQRRSPQPPADPLRTTRRRSSLSRRFSSPAMLDDIAAVEDGPTSVLYHSSESSSNALPPAPRVRYGVCSMSGGFAGNPKENQDGYFVYDGTDNNPEFVVAVLDGHGVNGRQASSFVEQYLGPRLLKDQVSQGDYKQAVHNSFLDTASELKKANVDVRESGTTAVSCARRGNKLVVANVGDSRCVLGRFDGKNWDAVPLSRDHKPSDPLEKARIERVGGFVEPSRVRGWGFQGPARVWRRRQTLMVSVQEGGLALSRSLGDTNLNSAGVSPEPEIIERPISPRDQLVVLGSDGVWDQLSNQQAVALAGRFADPQAAAQAIVKQARRRWMQDGGGYIDDVTALVLRFGTM